MPFEVVVGAGLFPIGTLVEAFAFGGGGGTFPIGKLVEAFANGGGGGTLPIGELVEAFALASGGGGGRMRCALLVGGTSWLGG